MLNYYLAAVNLSTILATLFGTTASQCSGSRPASDADCYLNHLARENVVRMGVEGGCDTPKAQIVYPHDSTKTYMPRGTILHRCNDMIGCCPQKEYSCQPISEEEIRVAFYALDCTASDRRPTPEYVLMKNHTRCACQPTSDSYQQSRPQRLMDSVCGSDSDRSFGVYRPAGGGVGNVQRQQRMYDLTYSKPYYGSPPYEQPSDRDQSAYRQRSDRDQYSSGQSSQSAPCRRDDRQSSRPLMDGQTVRGTIQLIVTGKQEQQHGCPYG